MGLKDFKISWEKIAKDDPLWAVCTDPSKKDNKWKIEDLLLTGEKEIQVVMDHIKSLGLEITKEGLALDFGCGVGRLTQSLAKRFGSCYGVDISPTMVQLANQYKKSESKCKFFVNDSEQLIQFKYDYFSFIYSSVTLQHIEIKWVQIYLKEFLRILRPDGILVFNMPSKDGRNISSIEKIRRKLKLRTRIKLLLKSTGLFRNITLSEHLMQMNCMPENKVKAIIEKNLGKVIDVQITNTASPNFNGELVYLQNEQEQEITSKQYVVTKLEK